MRWAVIRAQQIRFRWDRIVQSARECFLRLGVRATRIADVAAGAGMVRQTVYDSVSGRDELVNLAMRARSRELADMVRPNQPGPHLPLGDRLVSLLAAMIETARADAEFSMLIDSLPPERVLHYLIGPSDLTEVVIELLTPLLVEARGGAQLRTDAEIDEILEWVQTVLAPLMSRTDLTPQALRRALRLFVLPIALRHDALGTN